MTAVIEILFDILSVSSIFVLIALGVGVIVSMMGIFNFAHGELVMLGAYATYLATLLGLPVWFGMLVAPLAVAAFGLVLERLVIRRFYDAPVMAILVTWAVALIIRESVRALIRGQYLSVSSPLMGAFTIGDITLSKWRVMIILVTVLVMVVSYIFLTRSSFGLQIRAALENPALARASGIPTKRIFAFTFSFGSALAGLAGALMVPLFSLYADFGMPFMIKSFLAIMLGGFGGFEGPIIGAAMIGGGSALLPWIFQPVVADVTLFVIAIVIVRFWSEGVFARFKNK